MATNGFNSRREEKAIERELAALRAMPNVTILDDLSQAERIRSRDALLISRHIDLTNAPVWPPKARA